MAIETPQNTNNIEQIKKPKFRFMITRHAERLPTGELSEGGKEFAKSKGRQMSEAEVLKGYASDHPSKRAYDTAELITEESDIISLLTHKPYSTRIVEGIQYGMLGPDFKPLLAKAKVVIDTATLEAAGYSIERDEKGKLKVDIDKLSLEEQTKLAPIRAERQHLGLNLLLQNPEAVHRMAMGLAAQIVKELNIAERYKDMRDEKQPIKADVVLNTATHGAFTESLLKEAGVFVDEHGKESYGDYNIEGDFGGYIKPGESIYLDVDDIANLPERIPVTFEGAERQMQQKVFIDLTKLRALSDNYKKWVNLKEKNSK